MREVGVIKFEEKRCCCQVKEREQSLLPQDRRDKQLPEQNEGGHMNYHMKNSE